jgi:hypothetical protein
MLIPEGPKLAERGTLIGSQQERLWVKEIRKLMDTGHQTSVITTNYKLGADKVAAQMFSRWSQENYFGYAMRHYNIDRLTDYQLTEFPDPEKLIINPDRRRLERVLPTFPLFSHKLNYTVKSTL